MDKEIMLQKEIDHLQLMLKLEKSFNRTTEIYINTLKREIEYYKLLIKSEEMLNGYKD